MMGDKALIPIPRLLPFFVCCLYEPYPNLILAI